MDALVCLWTKNDFYDLMTENTNFEAITPLVRGYPNDQ